MDQRTVTALVEAAAAMVVMVALLGQGLVGPYLLVVAVYYLFLKHMDYV